MNKNFKYIYFIIINDLLIFFHYSIFNQLDNKYFNKKRLIKEIAKVYNRFNKVNINEIDEKINKKDTFAINDIKSNINIGFSIDKNFLLETMLTITSILATQHNTTKINFHIGITNNFDIESMVKIYELRYKINKLCAFNFYYLRESVLKMKNFHDKGEAVAGRIELPNYISDNIDKLIFFDVGDLIVLRDLTELYNFDMNQFWVLGVPEPSIINSFMKPIYNMSKYINTGSMLLNITKFKENKIWNIYIKNRNIKLSGDIAQTLFNIIIPDNKKNYLPFKFGGYSLYKNDHDNDLMKRDIFAFNQWFNSNLSLSLPDNPKSIKGILSDLYNPKFIHQFYGKWYKGQGLSIYRHLVKYFILLSGISHELCSKKPGYCV